MYGQLSLESAMTRWIQRGLVALFKTHVGASYCFVSNRDDTDAYDHDVLKEHGFRLLFETYENSSDDLCLGDDVVYVCSVTSDSIRDAFTKLGLLTYFFVKCEVGSIIDSAGDEILVIDPIRSPPIVYLGANVRLLDEKCEEEEIKVLLKAIFGEDRSIVGNAE